MRLLPQTTNNVAMGERPSFTIEEPIRAQRYQADGALSRQLSQSLESVQIAQEFRLQYDALQRENSTLREEVLRLQSELAEAQYGSNVDQLQLQQDWSQHYFQKGSEVYSNAMAAVAWTSDGYDAIHLYVNQNNVLTELTSVETVTPHPHARTQWDRNFVFPGALMPNSTIAVATSFGLRHLIPTSDLQTDQGRDVIRVFYFDATETLREWIYEGPVGWRQTPLQISGADTTNLAAICWAEGGCAEWSLFYATREVMGDGERQGGCLHELRYSGGSVQQRSRATQVGWDRERRGIEEANSQTNSQPQRRTTLQSSFSAAANANGTDRQILYLNRSTRQVQTLKWVGDRQNAWSTLTAVEEKTPQITSSSIASSFGVMFVAGNWWKRLFVQDGDEIVEWMDINNDHWSPGARFSNVSAEGAVVAVTSQSKGGQLRLYVFSIHQGRIIQTTYIQGQEPGWSSKAIVIRNL